MIRSCIVVLCTLNGTHICSNCKELDFCCCAISFRTNSGASLELPQQRNLLLHGFSEHEFSLNAHKVKLK